MTCKNVREGGREGEKKEKDEVEGRRREGKERKGKESNKDGGMDVPLSYRIVLYRSCRII